MPRAHERARLGLDLLVRFSDRARIGLGGDAQLLRLEEPQGDLVGAVGHLGEKGQPVGGRRAHDVTAPGESRSAT